MMTFGALFESLAAPITRKVFIALGLAVLTYTGVREAIEGLLTSAIANMAQVNPEVIQLIAMAGGFDSLGIIAGAVIARITFIQLKFFVPDGS